MAKDFSKRSSELPDERPSPVLRPATHSHTHPALQFTHPLPYGAILHEEGVQCVVVDDSFDWEYDRHLKRPLADTIIYELHVRGFTRDATSGVSHPGTYLGVIEKIPYLKSLGVTAVELMPVHEFARESPWGQKL